MPTGTYTIDAINNTEPLDTRYVADFPAELRAMKTRMNVAISSIGTLTGALMADGTNYMTGALGIGGAATGGNKLSVIGNSVFDGNATIAGRVFATSSGFVPGNTGVASASFLAAGGYGGGVVMIDGTHYSGMYAAAGALCLGSGTSAGIVEKVKIESSSFTASGATTCEVISKALGSYAGFRALSSGSNSSYVFFANANGEHGRIFSGNDNSLTFNIGASATALAISPTKQLIAYGDEINVGGAGDANQKRLSFQSSARYMYFCMNSDGLFNLYDNTVGANRWVTDPSGNFTARGNMVAEGSTIQVGSGNAGLKSLSLSNNVRAVHLEHAADGATCRLVDYGASVVRWTTDVAGNFTAAGNVTAYSDVRLKHDIVPIKDALNRLKSIRGVNFKWNRDNSTGIGFIAQEVEAIFPELVLDCADLKSVAYGNMTAVLVEAVKELSTQITELKLEVARLRGGM